MGKLLSKMFGKKEMKILILGLNAAGKTTILYKLKFNGCPTTVPTIGFNVETVTHKDVKFNVWDVGGQERIKPLWRHYYADTQGLVFVVDCADRERIDEARNELHRVIKDTEMRDALILVFANKQDVSDAMKPHEVGLSGFKETVAPAELDQSLDTRPIASTTDYTYPFATVLRLRVLQIVCGITFLIMGTVGFIEEKGRLNLGLGIPAGVATILAAAGSLHTTKGFGGYKPSTCLPGSSLRFLGPSVRIAVPLTILWGTACSFLTALVIQATRTLTALPELEIDDGKDNTKKDLTILASVELGLSIITLSAVIFLLRIDCRYDPD